MLRHSFLTVAAVAVGFLGAEASPCRPTTVTSLTDASSTVLSDATTVTSATSLAETTSVGVSETAITTSAETTLETLPETTSTTLATTTSVQAPVCVPTQVIINPGFDDSTSDDFAPWSSNGYLGQDHSVSGPNSLAFWFYNGMGEGSLSQSLDNLNGEYMFSYRWAVFSATNLMAGFSCTITPYIGSSVLQASDPYEMTGWTPDSQRWSTGGNTVSDAELTIKITCSGEYDSLTINLEDVTLTRLCGMQVLPDHVNFPVPQSEVSDTSDVLMRPFLFMKIAEKPMTELFDFAKTIASARSVIALGSWDDDIFSKVRNVFPHDPGIRTVHLLERNNDRLILGSHFELTAHDLQSFIIPQVINVQPNLASTRSSLVPIGTVIINPEVDVIPISTSARIHVLVATERRRVRSNKLTTR
ncbi:unnamed protein product [Fusarium equiseti]|uniref:Uncharacterized protein n=1 Tax=Fusarium equiseti TaxID=61235 RepID=A0A8J2NNG4_FUSEQ|nr:unnamed protein product [Fusarium equiseti]